MDRDAELLDRLANRADGYLTGVSSPVDFEDC
jgi:hypothetical protein